MSLTYPHITVYTFCLIPMITLGQPQARNILHGNISVVEKNGYVEIEAGKVIFPDSHVLFKFKFDDSTLREPACEVLHELSNIFLQITFGNKNSSLSSKISEALSYASKKTGDLLGYLHYSPKNCWPRNATAQNLKTRHRRGLLDGVGKALKYVFGTATTSDIDDLNNLMDTRFDTLHAHIKRNAADLGHLRKILSEMADITDELVIRSQHNELFNIINSITIFIAECESAVINHGEMKSLASRNIVSLNLFKGDSLRMTLEHIVVYEDVKAVVPLDNMMDYIKISRVHLEGDIIVLEVPIMVSPVVGKAIFITGIPNFFDNDDPKILEIPCNVVSMNLNKFACINDCHRLNSTLVCNNKLDQKLIKLMECFKSIKLNSKTVHRDCVYNKYSGTYYITNVPYGPQILYTQKELNISFDCNKMQNSKLVEGTIIFPHDCSLTSSLFSIPKSYYPTPLIHVLVPILKSHPNVQLHDDHLTFMVKNLTKDLRNMKDSNNLPMTIFSDQQSTGLLFAFILVALLLMLVAFLLYKAGIRCNFRRSEIDTNPDQLELIPPEPKDEGSLDGGVLNAACAVETKPRKLVIV